MANPHDFTAGDVLTAAQMDTIANRVVTDTTSGGRPGSPFESMTIYQTDDDRYVVYNGAAWATVNAVASTVTTSQTTTSTTYADLATTGPAVSVQTGTKALVFISCGLQNSGANNLNYVGFAISGATTVAAADTAALVAQFAGTGALVGQMTYVCLVTGLTAGVNTFTLRYRTNGGTFTAQNRHVAVIGHMP